MDVMVAEGVAMLVVVVVVVVAVVVAVRVILMSAVRRLVGRMLMMGVTGVMMRRGVGHCSPVWIGLPAQINGVGAGPPVARPSGVTNRTNGGWQGHRPPEAGWWRHGRSRRRPGGRGAV